MTKEEQKEFLFAYCESIAKKIAKDIDNGKVPPEWDGFELRHLVHLNSTFNDYLSKENIKGNRLRSSKRKECENIALINNLW